MSKPSPPAPIASAIGPCPTVFKILGHPAPEVYPAPSHHPTNPLEFWIKTILAIFRSPSAWMLHMKFGNIWLEKSFESVDRRRTDDGGLPYYKLLRSLRLRGAKNLSMEFYEHCITIIFALSHFDFYFFAIWHCKPLLKQHRT